MRALTFAPGQMGTLAVREVPDPEPGAGELLVQGLALGICGTDRELAAAVYGWAPPGEERMVIGHESLGRVLEAPAGSAFSPGDLVVGVVRRPDPVPCGACLHGEFDMCRNGRYSERGIKEFDGYGSERWTVEAGYSVRLDPSLESVGMLTEPMSVVAKAWEQIDRIGARAWFEPHMVLVTGGRADRVAGRAHGAAAGGLTCTCSTWLLKEDSSRDWFQTWAAPITRARP
ncbi:hypothetical protein GCM10020001_109820 [Nonomuraea salmonea]